LAPPLAARAEGQRVDADLLRSGLTPWLAGSDFVLIEGAGGLMSPISDEDYVADLACELRYPLLVVAPNVLGVINQTLQTLITAATFREGIDVAGVVLNELGADAAEDPSVASNFEQLVQHCVPPVLGRVPWQGAEFDRQIDWLAVMRDGYRDG
jgi:dethiobiotin synthetase